MVRFLAVAVLMVAAPVVAAPQQGDVLLIQQVQKEKGMSLPARGMSMAQVEQRFGAPLERLDARGGDRPQHPTINRWRYDSFIVYFERDRVIHSVINPPASDRGS